MPTPHSSNGCRRLWPQAHELGVARATFDAGIRGLEPDYALPDLALPGRPEAAAAAAGIRADAGAISARADLRSASPRRARNLPRNIATRWRASRRSSACPATSCWRSGRARPITAPSASRTTRCSVLATQAYVGKRKDFFRNEFLHALKMLQDGVPRANLRSSWGGAMGLTQFLPSEYYKYAVDFDGDGSADIWHSVPDALASAAKQLAGQRLAGGQALGDRGARAGQCRLHHRRAEPRAAGRRMAQARLRSGLRPQAHRRGTRRRSVLAACRKAPTGRPS